MSRAPLVVVDLSGLVHRYFHVTPGTAGRAAFGAIEKLVLTQAPALFALAEDANYPTFRHELMASWGATYKAKRVEGRDDNKHALGLEQIRIAGEMAEDVLGIRRLWARGFEADDVIAALVARARAERRLVRVVAWDKDLLQLVGDDVHLWDCLHHNFTDPAGVVSKLGVLPHQVVDYLSMVGDSSDSVPGVWGCGPVAAQAVLGRFGTLEAAFDSAARGRDSDPFWAANAKIWSRLAGDAPRLAADRASQLVRLREDVPLRGVDQLDELLVEGL